MEFFQKITTCIMGLVLALMMLPIVIAMCLFVIIGYIVCIPAGIKQWYQDKKEVKNEITNE